MELHEELTLGIDLGIGSCGWAVICEDNDSGEIVAWGARTFDVPETDKDRTPTNQIRREKRGLRKVLRRRRQRMNEIRRLFKESGLLKRDDKSALNIPRLDPWRLRAEGLDRRLTGEELAVALAHIAKHRGFKSNSKRKSNEASDDSKMLQAIRDTADKLAAYRTVGEMFVKDESYAGRKRNRDGDYSRSVLRADLEREVNLLFSLQRHMGNAWATEELEQAFITIAFFQRPLADSEDKVGPCPFVSDQQRAAIRSPSFELFRFLARLTALRLQSANGERALTPDEIASACADFGSQNGMTFKRLRKILSLDDGIRFDGVPLDDERKRDVVNRGQSNGCMQGTKALRDILGNAGWNTFRDAPEKLDRIAFVLTFREDINSIRKGLEDIGLEPVILDVLMDGVEHGEFSAFKGAGNISSKACRALIGHLMRGLVYSDACKAAGYDHAKRPETKLDQIANPVARKALTEAIKQVRAIVHEYGLPGHIHVELARDVGKSKEEREEISRGIDKRNKAKDRLVEQFREEVGGEPRGDDLLRFELWKEQNGRCLYTDTYIDPRKVVSSDNSVQVDHILPWSRSGDDSFVNKTLCLAGANQEKKGRTPYEWFGEDEKCWQTFVESVETNKNMKGFKKRNYLLKDAKKMEEKFRPRNLNDTRYATRLLLDMLARWYPDDGKVHVYARPGPLTDRLRRGWGVQDLKKSLEPDGEKRKADDRHHALDALIVAATSQSALARLTKAFQEEEKIGGHRGFSALPQPWPGFIEEVRERFARIFVSRAERHRARGEAHAATIRQIAERDGETIVFERKNVEALTEKDLDRIKDPERNAKLIENIRTWIADGKKKGTWPKSPKGDPVFKVRLQTTEKVGIRLNTGNPDRPGAVDRSKIVRVDVFENNAPKRRSKFLFVPIYAHQISDATAPNRAFTLRVDYEKWPQIGEGTNYLFSLYDMCFVEAEWRERGAGKPTYVEGYFRGIDVNDGRIRLSHQISKASNAKELQVRLSPTTILNLKKYHIDRLGRRFPIERETRTWHGAACT